MSPLVAAVVLLYVMVVVLAFAMAGLLAKLRELQLSTQAPAGGTPESATAIAAVAPREGHSLAAVLLIEEGCGVCQEVLPYFIDEMHTSAAAMDFIVLTDGNGTSISDGPRVVTDQVVHRALEPGWFPAILFVNSSHIIEHVEPAGSPEAIRSVLQVAQQRLAVAR